MRFEYKVDLYEHIYGDEKDPLETVSGVVEAEDHDQATKKARSFVASRIEQLRKQTGAIIGQGDLRVTYKPMQPQSEERVLDISEYQQTVLRACAISPNSEMFKLALIGLLGELGEIAEPVREHLYRGRDLNAESIEQEIGDVLWYLAVLCNALGLSLSSALQKNVEKLHNRFPDGSSPEGESSL